MATYAIVETGGKQHRVAEGDTICVEKLPAAAGEQVRLDRVLLVNRDGQVRVGAPTVEGAAVIARVAGHGRGRKILVFKYRPKKRYRRRYGHRQPFTRLVIEKIEA
ncbi:MAG: 50S ribosomal protein L21 [Limnochordales bacterium]|nr:50S ribosomal protein L21 [Limnochordales bacterium]